MEGTYTLGTLRVTLRCLKRKKTTLIPMCSKIFRRRVSVISTSVTEKKCSTLQPVRSYCKYMGLHDFTMNLKNVETISLTQMHEGRHAQAGGVEGDTTMSETQENKIYTGVLEDFSPESVSHFRLGGRESTTLQWARSY